MKRVARIGARGIKSDVEEAASCGNCEAVLTGEYCSACGQRRARRLSFRRTVSEAWAHLADFDFALARTFTGLSTRPGGLVLEYVAGRRGSYSNPFRYAFVVTTASVLAINLLGIDVRVPGIPLDTERERAAVRLLTSLMSYLFFPTILLLAWIQWRLARRPRFVYAEILVFDAYCLSHAGLFMIILGPILPPGRPAGLLLLLVCQLAYLAWCLRGVHGISWPSAAGRSLALVTGYIGIFNLIGLALINALALMGLF